MIGTRYELEILHQCGKRVKSKSCEILGPNYYVFRSDRGENGRGRGASVPPILNGVNVFWDLKEI